MDTGGDASEVETPHSDFEGGVWYKVSAGRKQKAEPRWILPLICNAGGVTKRDIGAIKIFETESLVEVSARSAQSFGRAIARSGRREDSITITRVNGARTACGPRDKLRGGVTKGKRNTPGAQRKNTPKSPSGARKA